MLDFNTNLFQSAVSWLGHNSFPYFETTKPNSIDQARENFYAAVGQTEAVSGGKPVWVTETGWPRSKLCLIQLHYILVNLFI
jgi:exo-beta-1,3-glucanase (GH17 family)